MAAYPTLPTELKIHVLTFLPEREDLSSFSRCDRGTYWLVSDILFSASFARRIKTRSPEFVFKTLFMHAVNHDSRNIAQWLVFHNLSPQLQTSFLPSTAEAAGISYLHFAILNDAPQVAVELAKHGTFIHDLSDHPDLEPLYLGMAMGQVQSNCLTRQLYIACSYALPRTTQYLLARGADPNHLSCFGLAPFHLAVQSRLPWRHFGRAKMGQLEDTSAWQTLVLRTTSTILNFGGDPNMRSRTSRLHDCGSQCWRSPDCSHRGQTPLHFACAGGIDAVVDLLLQHGANLASYDDEGYLPLYSAMSQGHITVSFRLMRKYAVPSSVIVVRPSQSTALHIAARFGLSTVVSSLLKDIPTASIVDSHGKTPCDEAMAQKHLELDSCISEIIDTLSAHGNPPKSTPQGRRNSKRNFKISSAVNWESDLNASALDRQITEVIRPYKAKEKGSPVSMSDPLSYGQIQRRLVITTEAFPALRTEFSASNEPVMSSVESPWFNDEQRKWLFTHRRPSEVMNGALGLGLSARSASDSEDSQCEQDAIDIGPNSHSARFWAALNSQTQRLEGPSTLLPPRKNDQQFVDNKSRNKKWVPLRW